MLPLRPRRRPDVRTTTSRPGTPARRALPAALTALALLTTAACGADAADAGVDPSAADWPAAVAPTDGEDVWVVWTAIDESTDSDTITAEVARLAEQGYDVEPTDPGCQEGAKEQLAGLTGIAAPVAVGVAFASEEDAGVFDTRDDGTTLSVTSGAWTC